MTHTGAKQLVAQVQLPPGWALDVMAADSWEAECCVILSCLVQDAYGQRGQIEVRRMGRLDPWRLRAMTPEHFTAWLFFDLVERQARHEAAEWFRVAGVRTFDPHATDAPEALR